MARVQFFLVPFAVLGSVTLLASSPAAANPKLNAQFLSSYFKHKDMMMSYFMPLLGGMPPLDDSPRMRKRRSHMARFLKNAKEDPSFVELLKRAKQVLSAMDADCKGRLRGVTNERDPEREWANWCQVAARRDEMLKLAVRVRVRNASAGLLDGFKLQAEKLDASKGVLKDWEESYYRNPKEAQAKILARFERALEVVGVKDTGPLFVDVDKALADLLVKIEAKVPEWKFKPSGRKTKDPLVVKTYTRTFPGIKIMQMTQITKDWEVRKNGLGIPTHRARGGDIFFQLPGEKWCRATRWVYLQDYNGKKYGQSYFEMSQDKGVLGIVSCK